MRFATLFLLEADTAFICEIKRLDVHSANPADVYSWLHFDKATQALELLEFVSMMQAEGEEQRAFRQGHLRFTPTAGTFTDTDGATQALRPLPPEHLPAALHAAIERFLR
ncbi:hypothetical protein LRS06_16640 [Hymenobacter sp. J193]|uniref:hypothetical protein n=1 Tax=Hymenobacter sp. J193 TaxID=2898429 RepID=UPI002150A072|nr:hypothetical protein [Hymenobacter sp. J193]MCR5889365.1 hypothetical protein [Hymenobacter sp. J193]